ncbi:MAG TPA: AIR synthase family protein, partial [Anaerolineales bacterium]
MSQFLPVGKLPVDLLARMLAQAPVNDPDVLQGPGVGLDCAVVAAGPKLWVFKSDPITFASEEIGWYAVQVNANDIATSGATPRWLMLTLLLPEGQTTPELAEAIARQVYDACRELGVAMIGGHTEITSGLARPIISATMIGEVDRDHLVSPQGANPGDRVLLTKGVPIEATALLAREFPERLSEALSPAELERARGYLYEPGISVLRDARIAQRAGRVTAMHDPTEGGLAGALWELADASGRSLAVNPSAVPIPSLAGRICQVFGLDPLATIASGALLLTAPPEDSASIRAALQQARIACADIGEVEAASPGKAPRVWAETGGNRTLLPRPPR